MFCKKSYIRWFFKFLIFILCGESPVLRFMDDYRGVMLDSIDVNSKYAIGGKSAPENSALVLC
ncbi:hypothetical protein D1B31_13835 [Neobacillus notoginsengisoli]|uniref:Uncharacterized protein n=1 Tax=Neobacillus notoginsengisoli TaxID=1578198 RepID=A0A417YSS2_9BACI|nr:hypothetical protein D1B31_13835 [Neobacillus notoginsengisoli]